MPVIYSRNFATGNQQYLSLSTENYLRIPSIGTSWNRLRIGILYSVGTVSESTLNIASPSLSLGICNGIANSPAVQFPTNAMGVAFPASPSTTSAAAAYTYNAGSAGNSYYSTATYTFFKNLAGTLTTGAVGAFTLNLSSNTTTGGALARRGLYILDMNKSAMISGNMTFGHMGNAVAHCALDIATADLYSALEWYTSAPTIQGTALSFLAVGNSIAFNESTTGAMDTIFLNWNLFTIPLQLYEIAVYRVG